MLAEYSLLELVLLVILPYNYIIAFLFIFILHFMIPNQSELNKRIIVLLIPYVAIIIFIAFTIYGITANILDFIIKIFKKEMQEEK